MLVERNEDMDVGVVLCCIYKYASIYKIDIGRKRRKKFIEAYAKLASKFMLIDESYSIRIKRAAEGLYKALEKNDALDLVNSTDDCACAIYLLTGIHDLGKDIAWVASAFEANLTRTQVLLSYTITEQYAANETEDSKDEID